MTEMVQARVDSKIKHQAAKIFDSLGLDMSTGIKIYLAKVVKDKGVPFSLLTENGFTEEQEKRILAESKATMAAFKAGKIPKITSAAELHKYLLT